MTAGKLVHALQDGVRSRDIPVAEVLFQGPKGKARSHRRMQAKSGEFGSKDKGAVLNGVIERLFSEPIPTAENLSGRTVVNRQSPHAIQAVRQIFAPFPKAVEQDFGIGVVGEKSMSAGREFVAQLGKIVNLAVE